MTLNRGWNSCKFDRDMQYVQNSFHTNIVNQESSVRLLGKEGGLISAEYTQSLEAGWGDRTCKDVAEGVGVCVNI